MNRFLLFAGILSVLAVPVLACGAGVSEVTPTPTKTPKMVRTLEPLPTPTLPVLAVPTATPLLPTNTPTPEVPTDTPTPEVPPTNTPAPPTEPPPTNTPPPPPPPTEAPPPPPPTEAPPPPPPTEAPPPPPPSNTGPTVVIDFPSGDTYQTGDDVEFRIIVSDPDGVSSFTWGLFAQNGSPLGLGGEKGCGNAGQCEVSGEFEAQLSGQFFLGVDAVDSRGNSVREIKQLYVG